METKMSKAALDLQAAIDNPQDAKVRVTINIDGDVLNRIKELADNDGDKYQPWLNKFLRKAILQEKDMVEMVKDKVMKELRKEIKGEYLKDKIS